MTREEYSEHLAEIERQMQEEHKHIIKLRWLYVILGLVLGLLIFGAMRSRAEAASLAWDCIGGCQTATQFNIKQDTGCTGTFITAATQSSNCTPTGCSNTSWPIPTTLIQGSTYCFEVTASNATGESAASNAVTFQVPLLIPTAPSNLRLGP